MSQLTDWEYQIFNLIHSLEVALTETRELQQKIAKAIVEEYNEEQAGEER